MKINFPSPEFDDAVAATCHGVASEEQLSALNEILRANAAARDEYILRVELHTRLASGPDLFVAAASEPMAPRAGESSAPARRFRWKPKGAWAIGFAATLALVAAGLWRWRVSETRPNAAPISKAVAMLDQTVGARWAVGGERLSVGAPLEPGWLRLESGLVHIVFYSGARVVIAGPAELQLLSANEAVFRRGKITAEVPPQARGFRIETPQGNVTDLGTAFGLEVNEGSTEVHVFKGEVTLQSGAGRPDDDLREGSGAVMDYSGAPRRIAADRTAFASLFAMQAMASAAELRRVAQWRAAGERLNRDSSLLVRFDFEGAPPSGWQVRNAADDSAASVEATLVGCQWGAGRWLGKRALEFQGVNDRLRFNVPGEFESVTLTAWVRVQGLDRKLNSLFMCDGFSAGTLHWLIRNDGVLGLTLVGAQAGDYQIATSPSVVTLDKFGMWLHLAVVVDGRARRVSHFVNGRRVADVALRIAPPYRVGAAELGNWNGMGFPETDPYMIRNFSGAMDDFCLFDRALAASEIQTLYAEGRPDLDAAAPRETLP